MKKNLVMFLALVLFALATPAVTVFAADTKETVDSKEDTIYDGVGIYQNCMPAVVYIEHPNGFGSGFFIESNIIVTNYHVINEISGDIDIFDMYDNHYSVKYILGYNETVDLALIEVNETSTSYLKKNTHEILPGSLVYTLGNSYGIPFIIAQGLFGKASWYIDGKDTIVHTAPISAGNSGGPLVNQYGEVLGINTFSAMGDAQNINYAVNIDEINLVNISKPMTFNQYLNRYNLENKIVDKSVAQIGDIVVMGKYEQDNILSDGTEDIEWIVIDSKDDELFVISKYCLDISCWNEDNEKVTWKDSEYRKFLSSFYDNCFSDKEKESIIKVNTSDGLSNRSDVPKINLYNEETYDYIFIPSTVELSVDYFKLNNCIENKLRSAEATEYCKAKGAAKWQDNKNTFYATRKQNIDYYVSVSVKGEFTLDKADGIGEFGYVALRPAMWIKK